MAEYREFAARFNAAIALLGFRTQKAVADALGITPGYLSELLSGKKFPSDTVLLLMEAKFGVNSNYLKDGTEPKFLQGREPGKGTGVREDQQAYNSALMREIIETVEEIFKKEKRYLPPTKKAELIDLLYEELSNEDADKEQRKAKVLRFTRLAS